MPAQHLDALPYIVRLRSDRVLLELIRCLCGAPGLGGSAGRRSFKAVMMEALEDFAPQRYRLDDTERTLRQSLQENPLEGGPDYSFDFLGSLFERHFTAHPRAIERKMGESAHERDMVDHVHPFVIAAHQLALRIDERRLSLEQAAEYFQSTHEQMHLPPSGGRDVLADNHVHFNGVTPPTMMLSGILRWPNLPQHWRGEGALEQLPLVQEFQCINAGRIRLEQIADIARICYGTIENALVSGVTNLIISRSVMSLQKIANGTKVTVRWWDGHRDWTRRAFTRQHSSAARLAVMADTFYRDGNFSAFFLSTLTLLHLVFRDADPRMWELRPFIRILIHCLGILRCYMVMGHGTGLRRFAHFYDSLLRQTDDTDIPVEQGNLERARAIYRAGTHRLNARITPGAILHLDRLAPLIHGLDRAILECTPAKDRDPQGEVLPSAVNWRTVNGLGLPGRGYQFTIHFIRTLGREVTFDPRAAERRRRESVTADALALDEFLHRSNSDRLPADRLPQGFYQNADISAWRRREVLHGLRFNIPQLVAGFDVAGIEPDLPPEVFAPALIHLRRDDIRRRPRLRQIAASVFEGSLRRPAIHIHVGEDFSCLLTGMRQVDEAITYCDLGQGDRIGHGLAIGLPPLQWLERNPILVLTQGEYFDNMVWAHAMLVRLLPLWPAAGTLLPVYEARIRRLAARLHGDDCAEWSPDLWHRLWRYRGLSPEAVRLGLSATPARGGDPVIRTSLRHARQLMESEQWGLSPLERQRLARLSAGSARRQSHDLFHRRSRLMTVYYRPNHPFNEVDLTGISPLEAEAWRAIQDFQIERCAHLGIIIEACPSSNLAIAPIESYAEHPLFRWCPPDEATLSPGALHNHFGIRSGPMDVCINTDDPGIFNTTLAGEFRQLERTARVALAVSPAATGRWIEKLRSIGERSHLVSCYNGATLVDIHL